MASRASARSVLVGTHTGGVHRQQVQQVTFLVVEPGLNGGEDPGIGAIDRPPQVAFGH
jgi:hypothetical protein